MKIRVVKFIIKNLFLCGFMCLFSCCKEEKRIHQTMLGNIFEFELSSDFRQENSYPIGNNIGTTYTYTSEDFNIFIDIYSKPHPNFQQTMQLFLDDKKQVYTSSVPVYKTQLDIKNKNNYPLVAFYGSGKYPYGFILPEFYSKYVVLMQTTDYYITITLSANPSRLPFTKINENKALNYLKPMVEGMTQKIFSDKK